MSSLSLLGCHLSLYHTTHICGISSCLGDCKSNKFTAMPLDPGNHSNTNC